MSVKSLIIDHSTGLKAAVVDGEEKNALVVATRPLKIYDNVLKFFINESYGADLNQNVTLGGTPVKIHNGIDNVLWTASAISGIWTFDSTAQAHAGTRSIDGTATGKNSTAQFAKGSSQDLTGYTSISGWIYLTGWGAGTQHLQFFGWNVSTGVIVGNLINIDDYINTGILNSWQKFTISLSDMGLAGATISAFRLVVTATSITPNFYLDDLQIEETGTPIEFQLEPDTGTWLHVNSFQILMADAYSGTVADGTMPSIPYDSLLGVSALVTGISYKRVTSGEIVSSAVIKQFLDFMAFSNANVTGYGSDGTNTWITVNMQFTEPVILKSEEEDKMSLTINDDLSDLLLLRVGAGSKVETR